MTTTQPATPVTPATTDAAPQRPPSHIQLSWVGDHRFEGGRPGGNKIQIDSSGQTGPSPLDALVLALAGCSCVDIVDILAKRRTPVTSLSVDAVAQRANAVPARVTSVQLNYTITGEGVERVHAERAIELAVTKYCSVRDSLDPEIPINWKLTLNGE